MTSKLGLGTAALGRPHYINLRHGNQNSYTLDEFRCQSLSVIEEAYNLGIRYFDTAPGYGMAEQLLLDWLKSKNDNSIEIATKWGYTYTANFSKNAKIHEVKEHTLKKLKEQWAVSKDFIPHLKVHQIHSATLQTGVLENKDVLDYLMKLKNENNIKIGITTTGDNQLEVIKKAMEIHFNGHFLFDLFQATYNILDQSLLKIKDQLLVAGRTIVIKEALANGRLLRSKTYQHYNKVYDALEKLAAKYEAGVDAICLNYCLQTMDDSIVLSGVSNIKQLKENLKVNHFKLSESDLHQLSLYCQNPVYYWSERNQLVWN